MMRSLRSALVPMTMPLAGLVGLLVGLLTLSRRRAINISTALWADMSCALIGLKVELSGAEHLAQPRPAVFILNHQSNADGFLVAKLIRRDIAFLGKAELARQPIRGRLMQWGGLILVDRSDSSAASRATQALASAIREDRKSAAIFPEGTRSHSRMPAAFQNGAFLIALRARVPIVPIVIHNSIDAQARGDTAFTPTTVKITVLPPLESSQWKVRNLDQHVTEVRAMYLETLGLAPDSS
jgi:putative phosphoserine phosphatase/1-acylglycerol-3-phosphate O-acyltransferase